MATTKAVSLLDTKNNGGSVLSGGTNTQLNTVAHGAPEVGVMKPVDGTDTNKALSGGTFAYDNVTPVAKKVSTTLSGVANDVLKSGAAQPGLRRKVNKIEGLTTSKVTSALRGGYYNSVTGKFDSSYPQSSNDSFGTDDAVTSSELQYMYGNPVPASGDYHS